MIENCSGKKCENFSRGGKENSPIFHIVRAVRKSVNFHMNWK
jgi:hypothetical protein